MAKRRVIGIGETILDIIFQKNQPTAAVPGGSVFNGLVSLARLGVDTTLVTEVGDDRVGKQILSYIEENQINTDYITQYPERQSPLSLAYLNDSNDAEYTFYKDYPNQRLTGDFPKFTKHDIVVFGSYYALNSVLRERMIDFLEAAQKADAIIYYDPNFRSNHLGEALKLTPEIMENLEYADIVRGSDEDFMNMWSLADAEKIYADKVAFYCKNLIITQGSKGPILQTSHFNEHFEVKPIEVVSSIGAGDNFNAGIIYGLIQQNIYKEEIEDLSVEEWEEIVAHGAALSAEVCLHLNNSVSKEWANNYIKKTK